MGVGGEESYNLEILCILVVLSFLHLVGFHTTVFFNEELNYHAFFSLCPYIFQHLMLTMLHKISV